MNWHNSVTKQLKIIKEHFVCFYINTSVGLPTSIHSPAVICSPSSCTRAVKQRAVKSLRAILLVNRSSLVLVCHLQLFYPALIIPGDSRYLGCVLVTLCLIYSFVGEVLTATFIKPRNRPSHFVGCFLVPHSSSLCPDSFQHSKKHCWDHIQFYPYHSQFKKIIILMGHLWSLIQRSQPLWFCLKIGSKGYLLQIPVSLVYEGLWFNLKIRNRCKNIII